MQFESTFKTPFYCLCVKIYSCPKTVAGELGLQSLLQTLARLRGGKDRILEHTEVQAKVLPVQDTAQSLVLLPRGQSPKTKKLDRTCTEF